MSPLLTVVEYCCLWDPLLPCPPPEGYSFFPSSFVLVFNSTTRCSSYFPPRGIQPGLAPSDAFFPPLGFFLERQLRRLLRTSGIRGPLHLRILSSVLLRAFSNLPAPRKRNLVGLISSLSLNLFPPLFVVSTRPMDPPGWIVVVRLLFFPVDF